MTPTPFPTPVVGELYRPGGRTGAGRGVRLLLALHPDCAICHRWLEARRPALREAVERWGGWMEVQDRGAGGAGEACVGWLAVLDEWDEVFHLTHLGPAHALPEADAVAEWIRFVAIQCEECERPEWPWVS